jgi:acyl carrier protein
MNNTMMNVDTDLKSKIKDYIIESTLDDVEKINDNTLIFEEGTLDSMGLLFLIEFLKDEFNIETNDEELVVENFQSINSILNFVEQKI